VFPQQEDDSIERWMNLPSPAPGTGEHYFVDLVVAFPFSLMVPALCSYSLPIRSGERRTPFLFDTFVTLIWLGDAQLQHWDILEFSRRARGDGRCAA
jgi:hypothetical protein